jgi:hypothetical protein
MRPRVALAGRVIVRVAAVAALIASMMAFNAKLYFWGGTRYASLYIDLAIWSFIIAGPVALWLSIKHARLALLPLPLQGAIFCLANCS